MSERLPVPVASLAALPAGSLALPYGTRIRLVELALAGTGHAGVEYFAGELKAGQSVRLTREPKNPHDAGAILARDARGRRLGYVPKPSNPILAALMDAGKRVEATLLASETGTMWPEIRIAIELVEE